jgi:DNA-binding LytR/AlgR family response regulator
MIGNDRFADLSQAPDFGRSLPAMQQTPQTPPRPQAPALGPAHHGYLAWIKAAKGGEVNLIKVGDVCYFRAEAKYTSVVTAERDFIIRRPIAALDAELDPALFCRIHRSTIVNLEAIAAVTRDMGGETIVRLRRRPERLAVSESYRRLFRPM